MNVDEDEYNSKTSDKRKKFDIKISKLEEKPFISHEFQNMNFKNK